MKTLIVLGLTHNQVPMIQKAQELGFRVVAIGATREVPPAAHVADRWEPIDTSDIAAVEELVLQEQAVGIVTCGTSTAICTAAAINDRHSFSHAVLPYQVAFRAVRKDSMRQCLGDLLPPGAVARTTDEMLRHAKQLGTHVAVKPVDGGGGRGISIVPAADDAALVEAHSLALATSRSDTVVVEEYLRGDVVGVESLVIDGQVFELAIADKTILPGYPTITLGVVFPTHLCEAIRKRVIARNREAIDRLGILWGPTHIDMVVAKRGMPRILDIGPRLAGGTLMSHLVPEALGYDVYRATIELAIGQIPPQPSPIPKGWHGSRFLIPGEPGQLLKILYSPDAVAQHSIKNIKQLKADGDSIDDIRDASARVLTYTTSADSYAQAKKNLEGFAKRVLIEMEENLVA